jgi:hypothetical protein
MSLVGTAHLTQARRLRAASHVPTAAASSVLSYQVQIPYSVNTLLYELSTCLSSVLLTHTLPGADWGAHSGGLFQ